MTHTIPNLEGAFPWRISIFHRRVNPELLAVICIDVSPFRRTGACGSA